LGEAYQVADDIRDVMGHAQALGKPVGQDACTVAPA
jgi:geranylgeranyl diphosphate synthase type II